GTLNIAAGGTTLDLGNLTLTDSTVNVNSNSFAINGSLAVNGSFNNSTINLSGSGLSVGGAVTMNDVPGGPFQGIVLNPVSGGAVSSLTAGGPVSIGLSNFLVLNGGGNVLNASGLTNNGTIHTGLNDIADFRGGTGQFSNLSGGVLAG